MEGSNSVRCSVLGRIHSPITRAPGGGGWLVGWHANTETLGYCLHERVSG